MSLAPANALMIGTGEYTTGFVHNAASTSDKGAGVVALTLFDLRARGALGTLSMAGTNGTKFPEIRRHLATVIGKRYQGLDLSFESHPADETGSDPRAYLTALDRLSPGDAVLVFTPDDTHCEIAREAVRRRCHVLVAKPLVKTLEEHRELRREADEAGVLVAMEVHKRWDPIYRDARDRIRALGDFSFFNSYMSQPKSQLDTFRAWAGRSSDISYYLNAHHVDFSAWALAGIARPVSVVAHASAGVAQGRGMPTEDLITLSVEWENLSTGNPATAVYTASWIAPPGDVHSQQRFFYVGHEGEVQVDQAHRGYGVATDQAGFRSPNPLFMKYEPDGKGRFAGQDGYGYRSIETFVTAANSIRAGSSTPADWRSELATVEDTLAVTAILEAGRRSLDQGGARITLHYDGQRVTGLR